MKDEEDCKERYENSIIADLRMKIAKLEDEKRKAESELESSKMRCKELSERLSMLGKGVDTQEDIGEVTKQSPGIYGYFGLYMFWLIYVRFGSCIIKVLLFLCCMVSGAKDGEVYLCSHSSFRRRSY